MEPAWEAAKDDEPPADDTAEEPPAPRDALKELPPPDDAPGGAGLTAPREKPDENMVDTRRSNPPFPSVVYAAELFFGRKLKRMSIITTASKPGQRGSVRGRGVSEWRARALAKAAGTFPCEWA